MRPSHNNHRAVVKAVNYSCDRPFGLPRISCATSLELTALTPDAFLRLETPRLRGKRKVTLPRVSIQK